MTATHPIIFQPKMVRAILAGEKTQTRRLVKGVNASLLDDGITQEVDEPYQPGDLLWVRETFWQKCDVIERINDMNEREPVGRRWRGAPIYVADQPTRPDGGPHECRPSIHMPRWASRLTLEVTSVRPQRLQDITPDDAICEGCDVTTPDPTEYYSIAKWRADIREEFARLWDRINGKGAWARNPCVWRIEFRPILANVDEVQRGRGGQQSGGTNA